MILFIYTRYTFCPFLSLIYKFLIVINFINFGPHEYVLTHNVIARSWTYLNVNVYYHFKSHTFLKISSQDYMESTYSSNSVWLLLYSLKTSNPGLPMPNVYPLLSMLGNKGFPHLTEKCLNLTHFAQWLSDFYPPRGKEGLIPFAKLVYFLVSFFI